MHNNIDTTHHLFSLPDELFIENVYIYTLQREADKAGKKYFLSQLREGLLGKQEIFYILKNSQEGKNIHLLNKKDKYYHILHKLYKIPLLGYLLRSVIILFTLPHREIKRQKAYAQLEKELYTLHKEKCSYDDFYTITQHLNLNTLHLLKKLPKKILLCSNAYPPNFIGGAELIAHYQALELKAQGYEVEVFTGDFNSNTEHYGIKTEIYEGIRVHRVKVTPDDFDAGDINFIHPHIEAHFETIVTTFKPSIVHMHNIIGLSVRLVSMAKAHNIKTVMTLHDGWGFCFKNTMMRNDGSFCQNFSECQKCQEYINDNNADIPMHIRQDYIKYLLEDIDYFISPSHYLKEQYVKAGFDTNSIIVISNGIDVEKFKLPKIPSDKIRFTFIGYLGHHKGVKLIVEALKYIKKRENILVTIVGEGPLKEELDTYVRTHQLETYVAFKGKIDNREVPTLFRHTDVYILPSQWPENQPVTITEAFASKTPVIGTDFGGIKELVHPHTTGLLFPMGESQALAASMQFFIDNPQKITEYGENAYHFIKERDFSHQIQQLTTLYHAPLLLKYHKKPLLVAYIGDSTDTKAQEKIHLARLKHKNIIFIPLSWLTEDMQKNAITWNVEEDLILHH